MQNSDSVPSPRHSGGIRLSTQRWKGPETRWGFGERVDTDIARERLLDAARFCYGRFGAASTSMSDIASQAKVTRPTVYRYFRSRQEVVDAVVRRDLNRFWDQLEQSVSREGDFGAFLVDSLIFILQHAYQSPSPHLIFSPDLLTKLGELLLADVSTPGLNHHPIYSFALRPGAKIPDDLNTAVEWFNRLALSYITSPAAVDLDLLRAHLTAICPWRSL